MANLFQLYHISALVQAAEAANGAKPDNPGMPAELRAAFVEYDR